MVKFVLCASFGAAIAQQPLPNVAEIELNSTWHDHHHHHHGYAPYLDHLGQDCFAACYGVTGKCPSNFCGTGGWCCRFGLEWDTPGCYHVGCHGKHCCARRGGFTLEDSVANATEELGEAKHDRRDGDLDEHNRHEGDLDEHDQREGDFGGEHDPREGDLNITGTWHDHHHYHDWDDRRHGHHHDHHHDSHGYTPYLDHLGEDCFTACYGVTGKCPSNFCGTGGWCCRFGLEWDTPGCYHVGCHGKHCCAQRGGFTLEDSAANATEVLV